MGLQQPNFRSSSMLYHSAALSFELSLPGREGMKQSLLAFELTILMEDTAI